MSEPAGEMERVPWVSKDTTIPIVHLKVFSGGVRLADAVDAVVLSDADALELAWALMAELGGKEESEPDEAPQEDDVPPETEVHVELYRSEGELVLADSICEAVTRRVMDRIARSMADDE